MILGFIIVLAVSNYVSAADVHVPSYASVWTDGVYKCGAVFYSEKVLITVSHCLIPGNTTIRYGSDILNKTSKLHVISSAKYEIDKINRHDLAMIELEQPARFDKHTSKLVIPTQFPKAGDAVTIVRQGRDDNNRLTGRLNSANMTIQKTEDCLETIGKIYGENREDEKYLKEAVFCLESNLEGASPGDSGSPTLWRSHGTDHVIGLTLGGVRNGKKLNGVYYSIHVNLLYEDYIEWFESLH